MKRLGVIFLSPDFEDVFGCLCEIKTMENELLAIGRIGVYLPEDRSLVVVPCEGDEMPNVRYATRVKVNVSHSRGLIDLYGSVYIAHSSFWRLFDLSFYGRSERRGNFRIRIRSRAVVGQIAERSTKEGQDAADGQAVQYPCLVTSVSLSGLLIAVDDAACSYRIGARLQVSGLSIGEDSHVFNLQCRVKRKDRHEQLGRLFGCEITDLDGREVEKLCQAIFAQQRRDIQRKHGTL